LQYVEHLASLNSETLLGLSAALLMTGASYFCGFMLVSWTRTLIGTVLTQLGADDAAIPEASSNANPNPSTTSLSTAPLTPNLLASWWFGVFPLWLAIHTLYLSLFYPPIGVLAWTVCLGLLGALALVDARTGILPNELTLPLLLLGLGWQGWLAQGVPQTPYLLGAVLGYAVPRLFNTLGRWVKGRDVLGQGDAKLLSGIGAWLGVSALPHVWVIASFAVLVYTACRRVARRSYVPFGPFLVFGVDLLLMVRHV